ncbi:MAG: FMN-binding protein [Lapillicoccus sp.]
MRRIVLGFMGTLSGLVLLFSYHTSTSSKMAIASGAGGATDTSPSTGSSPAASGATPSTGTSGTTSSPSSSAATPSAAPTSAAAAGTGTYTGAAVNTRWGIVQVRITVAGGKITASTAVQYPQNNSRDRQINAYAVPALNQEVVTAQSDSIDTVSGATVTSDGYVQSLQSALDQAHL